MADPKLIRVKLIVQKLSELIEQTAEMDTITFDELERRRGLIQSYNRNLTDEIRQYLQIVSDPSTEEVESCTRVQLRAEEILVNLRVLQDNSAREADKAKDLEPTAKLPKLTLPTFRGDILRWAEFWDRFNSNIHSRPLSGADKLAYLMGCLENEALHAIEGLSVTHANYDVALGILRDRYGDVQKVLDAHYEAIHGLRRAQYNKSECRGNLDTIERHLRVLQALGEETNGNHLRTTILHKFPEKVVYELHLLSCTESVESIRKGLQRIVTAMEKAGGEVSPAVPSTSKEITTGALHVGVATKPTQRGAVKTKRPPASRLAAKPTLNIRKRSCMDKNQTPAKKSMQDCLFCGGPHYNADCVEVKNIEERRKKLGKRCFLCFREGHRASACYSKKLCYYCKEKHNQSLCPIRNKGNLATTLSLPSAIDNEPNCYSFLQTAVITARRQGGVKSKSCRLLLDSGSQRSYITERLAKELGLTPERKDLLTIFVFGANAPVEVSSPSAPVEIESRRGVRRIIQVNFVPHITNSVLPPGPLGNVDVVADDGSAGDSIQLLVGNDYYFSFIRDEKRKLGNHIYLLNTDFGWMMTGKNIEDKNDPLSVITYCRCQEASYLAEPDLPLRDPDIKFLWALESIGITDSPKTTREEEAVEHFNKTVRYLDNRYQVKWPWISYPPDLPTNYGLAYGRLSSLVKRLTPEMKEEYNKIMQDQLNAGIIEVIDPSNINLPGRPVHYLPHHVIMQKGKKSRIVYDASAKLKDSKSLNECMYRGPLMLEDLTALLLKFRLNKIGVTADIEKAFLQVGLQEEDRDVTRFLWLKDATKGLSEDNLIHLRFCRVPFGIVASPFLLTATIRHHLAKGDGSLVTEIAEKTYVDNLVTGAETLEGARKLVNKARAAFAELSMNIRDWISNENQLMKHIPKQYQSGETEQTKVLGLTWHTQTDLLKLKLDERSHKHTTKSKREILRNLASIYDPCGFAAPLTLPAKLLVQELWKRKLKWDSPLPEELEDEWRGAQSLMDAAKEIEVPRYVGDTSRENTFCELHCFTDASKRAFAAVVYLRLVSKEGSRPRTVFLMAKSRVTPISYKEDLKIPKLELLGFVIGKRLLSYVKETLGLDIERTCLWTDSEIILYWMKSEKLLPPFVARRINEVKQMKEIEPRYVSSESNPADIATRSETWQVKKELWSNGPQFLSLSEEDWPKSRDHSQAALFTTLEQETGDIEMEVINEGEEELESPCEEAETQTGKTSENEQTETEKILSLQKTHFPEEVAGKKTSLTRNLGLFTDQDGILRCRGRIMNSVCPYDMRHPILIPKNSEFTDDLVRETHEKYYHVGAPHTLSVIRQRYWIPQGKAKVQRIIRRCQQCVKHGGGPYKLPPTPALPPERANYSAPFTYTGVDYFGPLLINENAQTQKRWICLYTCLAVRAVHLECVRDLTAEECLLAMRRFISARGCPELIVSDNALQFKLTAEVMTEAQFSGEKIRWKFIPQLSPWYGAFYERLIGIVKNCLKKTIGKRLLNDTQLSTIIKEVEAVTNSRPLTCIGSDIEYVLRPSDFLTLGKSVPIEASIQNQKPGGTVTRDNLIQGWKKGLQILEEFKRMFQSQYLCSLRERYRHSPKEPRIRSKRVPQVGDVIQIKGESKNRENWQVGKISSLAKGADGESRVAKINIGGKEFVRSVGQLYPLEVEEEDSQGASVDSVVGRCFDSAPRVQFPVEGRREAPLGAATSSSEDLPQYPDATALDFPASAIEPEGQNDRAESSSETGATSGVEEAPPLATEEKTKRMAATRAREKIALWTSQLLTLLN